MSVEVSADSVKKNLEEILAHLPHGDTATLIIFEDKPMAVGSTSSHRSQGKRS
jgi:hypothetical protein